MYISGEMRTRKVAEDANFLSTKCRQQEALPAKNERSEDMVPGDVDGKNMLIVLREMPAHLRPASMG
jgi:hypothetical protein